MNNILKPITAPERLQEPNLDVLLDYVGMYISKAIDKQAYLTSIEANIKACSNALDDLLHMVRNHPLHRLNQPNQSTFYSVKEATALLKLDKQKVLRMIRTEKLSGIREGNKFLIHKWSVNQFMYNTTSLPQTGSTTTTYSNIDNRTTSKFSDNSFSLDIFKQNNQT